MICTKLLDVLVEQRQRQQRVLGEVPLEGQVVRVRAIRIELRIAGGHRLVRAGDVDRGARREDAEAGRLPPPFGRAITFAAAARTRN